ncbi:integrase, partial [Methylobacterium sp. BE186]|uniref:tyrosine-type recombinase/integrase n=1 Tax=Methylobacterium sp. BE186 TaxID=2817715 RepID=UPI002866B323
MVNKSPLKLTRASIDRLPAPDPSGRQRLLFDAELKGFGVLISGKTEAKSYVVQRDVNGKTRRITVGRTNVLSLEEARRKAIGLLAQLAGGIDPKEEKRREQANAITLSEALESYLTARKVLKPSTVRDYRANVDRYLPDWKDRPLRSITREMVAARHTLIASQISQRAPRRERQRGMGSAGPGTSLVSAAGSSSANGAMRVLRLVFNHALAVNPEIGSNPVGRLSATKAWFKEERRTDLVRAHELPAWYRTVHDLPNPVQRDYLKLLLFTGLRRNEAACLTWDQVDLRGRLLTISENKASRPLQLPLSDQLMDLLVARRALGLAGPWVFPANSRSGHIEEPRAALEAVAASCGIWVSVHGLRRTFITVAESCDLSAYALKALVNHSLGRDVTAGYIISDPERLREPMQRVTNRLKELIG